jgi:hypothetical protein
MYAEIKCAYDDGTSSGKTLRFEADAARLKLFVGTKGKFLEIRSKDLRIDGAQVPKTYNEELCLELSPDDLVKILDFAVRNKLLELTVRR